MNILSLSDTPIPFIYSSQVRNRFPNTDVIIGCGDLAYKYLEYVYNALGVPLFFVRGNHDQAIEYSEEGQRTHPNGGIDLHRKVCSYRGLSLAGVEGSLRYRNGLFQYSQSEMWLNVLNLVPVLIRNRAIFGRYLDIFVSHAPPRGIHDETDLAHQGIQAFRWLIDVFQPSYFFHGHIHYFSPETQTESVCGRTRVINTFGYRFTQTDLPPASP